MRQTITPRGARQKLAMYMNNQLALHAKSHIFVLRAAPPIGSVHYQAAFPNAAERSAACLKP